MDGLTGGESGARRRLQIRRLVARSAQPVLVVSDQAVISLLAFGTSAAIGMVAGPAELGSFALVWIAMTLLMAASESLIVAPFTAMLATTPADRLRTYAGGVFLHQAVVGVVAALVLWGSAALCATLGHRESAVVLGAAGLTAPALLAREFGRRTFLARHAAWDALRLDVLSAALQGLGLLAFTLAGTLSAATACLCIAFGNAAASLLWWLASRRSLALSWGSALAALRRNRAFARTSFAALITFLLQLYAAPLALWLVADRASVGLFAACHALVMVSNPLVQGLANYLMPALAQMTPTPNDLASAVRNASRLIFLAMTAFTLPFLLAGERLLILVFGPTFEPGGTVAFLACAALVRATLMPASIALWVTGRSRDNAVANLFGLAVFVLLFWGAFPAWGVPGTALAVLVGDVAAGGLRLALFFRLPRVSKTIG